MMMPDGRAQNRDQRHSQQQRWEGHHDVRDAHEHRSLSSRRIARGRPYHRADREGHQVGQHADRQAHPGAVEQTAQQVATVGVGAQQKARAAVREQRARQRRAVQGQTIAELLGRIVGRNQRRQQRQQHNQRHQRQPGQRRPVAPEAPPDDAPIAIGLGSQRRRRTVDRLRRTQCLRAHALVPIRVECARTCADSDVPDHTQVHLGLRAATWALRALTRPVRRFANEHQ